MHPFSWLRTKLRLSKLAGVLSFLPVLSAAAAEQKPAPATPPSGAKAPANSNGNWLSSLLTRPFDPNPRLEMTVVTELTDAGRKLPPVAREHPAYYQDESSGNREMGATVAREQTMTAEEVRPVLVRALATNGYQPAQLPEHPPSLMVFYVWGTHNAIDPEFADLSMDQLRRNVLDRAALVGGKKFSNEVAELMQYAQDWELANRAGPPPLIFFLMRKPNNEALLYQSAGDVFYVVASAFDYQSVAKGQPVLLWRTRMTVSSQGVQMKKAIPAVVASAGRYFGQEMNEPAIIHHRATPDGKVEIGTATVVKPQAESAPAQKK